MTNIEYILNKIFLEVDRWLLEQTFKPNPYFNSGETDSLEFIIKNEVINRHLIPDMDTAGGEIMDIRLDDLTPLETGYGFVYHVPFNRTNGRFILHADLVGEGVYDLQHTTGNIASTMERLLDSTQGLNISATGKVYTRQNNVLITKVQLAGLNIFARCRISNDPELNNWNFSYMPEIAELGVLLTKAIVYTTLNRSLGDASAVSGTTNQYTRSALDSYADAMQLYKEKSIPLTKYAALQDPKIHEMIISGLVNI